MSKRWTTHNLERHIYLRKLKKKRPLTVPEKEEFGGLQNKLMLRVESEKARLSERPDGVTDWLEYEGQERECEKAGIARSTLDYITQLEADSKRLDKLREWLATGALSGLCGDERWKNGYLSAIYDVKRLLEEQDHE